jgi:hypothetical protein
VSALKISIFKSLFNAKRVMKKLYFAAIFCFLLVVSLVFISSFLIGSPKNELPDVLVGIDVAYSDIEEIKTLVDKVSPYTNLFVIGSTGISHDQMKLEETCQYLTNQDLQFIVYTDNPRRLELINNVTKKYEDNFIGIYYLDEQGGRQLDIYEYRWVEGAENYTDAANQFVEGLNWWLNLRSIRNETFPYAPSDFSLFTSDYSLYWFDYQAGYDTVFAEFGWNYSRQLNVALCRGAATVQNKEWGVIITWTYNHPPYIESGSELFEDMVLAYENGAKYILVFDTNEDYAEGILKEEHFEALENFWQYIKTNPRNSNQIEKRVAFVLPKDFGYGFRGPEDKIWGLWEDNVLSLEMSYHLGSYLEEYGINLDIIYGNEITTNEIYRKYIFWNGIIISHP